MIANRSVLSSTIIPERPYDDVPQASDWLCRTFGFIERLRIAGPRAQLVFGDRAVIVTARGAKIPQPPTDHPSGERQYSAEEIGRHLWTLSESIADIDPASWGGTLR